MSNNDEIERRWIVTGFNEPLSTIKKLPSTRLSQGYLDLPDQIRVRIYEKAGRFDAEITRKIGKGLRRREENHDISIGAAELLLETTNYKIDKTRYVRDGWEIDFFHGKLEGLILAEKELDSADEPCPIPEWLNVGPEVTETLSNKQLAMTSHFLEGDVEELTRKSTTIPRIVLTGGPCAGKSTLIEELRKTGDFHCVPELATVVMGQFGIMPDSDFEMFQRTLFRIQRSIEEGAARQAIKNGKKALILDRGSLDSAGFVPGGWQQFEKIVGINRADEFNNYDIVVFIPVPSKEIYETHKANNPVRRETWEQACAASAKLYDAWLGHPNFVGLGGQGFPFEKRAEIVQRLTDPEFLKKVRLERVELPE